MYYYHHTIHIHNYRTLKTDILLANKVDLITKFNNYEYFEHGY